MNEVVDIAQYLYYKRIAYGIDISILAFYYTLLICILFQTKATERRITYSFVFSILVNSAMVICNSTCWACFANPEYQDTYRVFATISLFLSTITPIGTSMIVNSTISHKANYNMKFFKMMYLLFFLTGLTVFIPSFRDKLFIITDQSIMQISGWFISFYALSFVYMVICCVYGFKKIKQIGTSDSIIIFIFCLMPFASVITGAWYRTVLAYLLTALSLLVFYCVSYQNRLQFLAKEKSDQELELANMQKTLLINQIKPHFIYNSLSTIKYLCETDPEKASELCDNFSSFLRANIDSIDNEGLVDIDNEIDNVENYLKIEQARFGERIKYVLDIKTHDFSVPVLSIETLVENAVKHGICQKKEGGTITISTFEDEDNYYVKQSDDGVGFDADECLNDDKNHTGLKNTIKRFKIELEAEVKIESEISRGTTITITMPKED